MILYEGDSLIDSQPIVVIATEDENPKTGRMLCTWILRQDRPPSEAAYDGSDRAICGDCKFRAVADAFTEDDDAKSETASTRTCYVRLTSETADEAMSPDDVWTAWHESERMGPQSPKDWKCETYPVAGGGEEGLWGYSGKLPVRIGSFGDPAAVPISVWSVLLEDSVGHTGFTHMWRTCNQMLRLWCMASVDTPEERDEAQKMGWRTFLVVPEKDADPFYGKITDTLFSYKRRFGVDILCPATDPHPKRNTTCATCLLCNGIGGNCSKSIWEVVHGENAENHEWQG